MEDRSQRMKQRMRNSACPVRDLLSPRRVLDYSALELKPFLPGALVRCGGRFYQLTDPRRRPFAALNSVFSPVGSLFDKLRVARIRSRSTSGTIDDRFHDPETTTLQSLENAGFSSAMIERFFRPFLGGIFLDPTLQTSSRMFHFVFRMVSFGNACRRRAWRPSRDNSAPSYGPRDESLVSVTVLAAAS